MEANENKDVNEMTMTQENKEKKTLTPEERKAANTRRAINQSLKKKYPEMSAKQRYAKTKDIFEYQQKNGISEETKAANTRRAINQNLKKKYPEMSVKARYERTKEIYESQQKKEKPSVMKQLSDMKEQRTQAEKEQPVKEQTNHKTTDKGER